MSVSSINQSPSYTSDYQTKDDEGSNKKGSSKEDVQEQLKKLLEKYEQGKSELWSQLLEASNEIQKDLSLSRSEDPTKEQAGYKPSEVLNFYMTIFKYLGQRRVDTENCGIDQLQVNNNEVSRINQVEKKNESEIAEMKQREAQLEALKQKLNKLPKDSKQRQALQNQIDNLQGSINTLQSQDQALDTKRNSLNRNADSEYLSMQDVLIGLSMLFGSIATLADEKSKFEADQKEVQKFIDHLVAQKELDKEIEKSSIKQVGISGSELSSIFGSFDSGASSSAEVSV